MLSLDDTLDPALTGAVFATQGAIAGFLEPTGTAAAPGLDLQIASAHLTAAGAPQTGALTAPDPGPGAAQPLRRAARRRRRLLHAPPAPATAGTQSAPSFRRATVPADGTDGLRVDVSGITFSAPTYALSRTAKAAPHLGRAAAARRPPSPPPP